MLRIKNTLNNTLYQTTAGLIIASFFLPYVVWAATENPASQAVAAQPVNKKCDEKEPIRTKEEYGDAADTDECIKLKKENQEKTDETGPDAREPDQAAIYNAKAAMAAINGSDEDCGPVAAAIGCDQLFENQVSSPPPDIGPDPLEYSVTDPTIPPPGAVILDPNKEAPPGAVDVDPDLQRPGESAEEYFFRVATTPCTDCGLEGFAEDVRNTRENELRNAQLLKRALAEAKKNGTPAGEEIVRAIRAAYRAEMRARQAEADYNDERILKESNAVNEAYKSTNLGQLDKLSLAELQKRRDELAAKGAILKEVRIATNALAEASFKKGLDFQTLDSYRTAANQIKFMSDLKTGVSLPHEDGLKLQFRTQYGLLPGINDDTYVSPLDDFSKFLGSGNEESPKNLRFYSPNDGFWAGKMPSPIVPFDEIISTFKQH